MGLGYEWRHDRKREFGDFEKDVNWDFDSGPGSSPGGYGMSGAYIGSVSWDFDSGRGSPAGDWLWAMKEVSIVKIVFLSPRIEKLNSWRVVSVSGLLCNVNILHIHILAMRHQYTEGRLSKYISPLPPHSRTYSQT